MAKNMFFCDFLKKMIFDNKAISPLYCWWNFVSNNVYSYKLLFIGKKVMFNNLKKVMCSFPRKHFNVYLLLKFNMKWSLLIWKFHPCQVLKPSFYHKAYRNKWMEIMLELRDIIGPSQPISLYTCSAYWNLDISLVALGHVGCFCPWVWLRGLRLNWNLLIMACVGIWYWMCYYIDITWTQMVEKEG